jgi:hypothetical protein
MTQTPQRGAPPENEKRRPVGTKAADLENIKQNQNHLTTTAAVSLREMARGNAPDAAAPRSKPRPVQLTPANGCVLFFERIVDHHNGRVMWRSHEIPLDQIEATIATVGSA